MFETIWEQENDYPESVDEFEKRLRDYGYNDEDIAELRQLLKSEEFLS